MLILSAAPAMVAVHHLAAALSTYGHHVVAANGRNEAETLVRSVRFDLILLSLALSGTTVAALIRRLRADGVVTPIVVLSGEAGASERIAALEAGADDVVGEGIDPAEIEARLRAAARARNEARAAGRTAGGEPGDAASASLTHGVMRAGDIEVDGQRLKATRAGRVLALARLEFRLLCELVRRADEIVTREELLKSVWGLEIKPKANLVEAHIRRLREQLIRPGERDPIRTVRGLGYQLRSAK